MSGAPFTMRTGNSLGVAPIQFITLTPNPLFSRIPGSAIWRLLFFFSFFFALPQLNCKLQNLTSLQMSSFSAHLPHIDAGGSKANLIARQSYFVYTPSWLFLCQDLSLRNLAPYIFDCNSPLCEQLHPQIFSRLVAQN